MGAQHSVPLSHEIHEVKLRGCVESSGNPFVPTLVEVKGQASACVLQAHGPVVISHHCHRRIKVLLVDSPSCGLSSTEVGVALPAID